MRNKRRKAAEADSMEELAKEIMFDDAVSYNLISGLMSDDVPV